MDFDSSLDNFVANLTNIVRPNKFLVEVFPPPILGFTLNDIDVLRYYAQSATIPDRNFNESVIKFYGMEYKIPASEIIQDLTITFIVDSDWKNRNLFEQWATLISSRTPTQNADKADAQELFSESFIVVKQLDFNSNIIAEYLFENVFPKTVDQIELNQETFDTYETFQVTFGYSYWVTQNRTLGNIT